MELMALDSRSKEDSGEEPQRKEATNFGGENATINPKILESYDPWMLARRQPRRIQPIK